RERGLAQQPPIAAVMNGDLRALLPDLAGHDHRQRELSRDLRETVVGVQQRAGGREAELHLAGLRELVAVRLERAHHRLADDDLLGAVERRNAGAFPGRGQGAAARRADEQRHQHTGAGGRHCVITPVVTAVAQAEMQAIWDDVSPASTDIVLPHVTLLLSILSSSKPVAGFEPATRYGFPASPQSAPAATLVDGPWPTRRPTT